MRYGNACIRPRVSSKAQAAVTKLIAESPSNAAAAMPYTINTCMTSGYSSTQLLSTRRQRWSAPASVLAVLFDMMRERAQAGEDLLVILVVGAQLETVLIRDGERELERIDRIEAEAFAEQ